MSRLISWLSGSGGLLALSQVRVLVAVAQFLGLVDAGGRAAGHRRAENTCNFSCIPWKYRASVELWLTERKSGTFFMSSQTFWGENVDFDGGESARVVNLPSEDLPDSRHCRLGGLLQWEITQTAVYQWNRSPENDGTKEQLRVANGMRLMAKVLLIDLFQFLGAGLCLDQLAMATKFHKIKRMELFYQKKTFSLGFKNCHTLLLCASLKHRWIHLFSIFFSK